MRVYIHIPFCASKCPYCAFGSICDKSLKEQYFYALKKDIEFYKIHLQKQKIDSIFFGGGTPSVVEADFYTEILGCLKEFCAKNAEITFEANPNSATLNWLKKIKNLGANRISFGAQSFDGKKLNFLGRTHSTNDIFKAVENAKTACFKNINVDLIYGTKLDNKKLLACELENIAKLEIQHISAYSLTLENSTPFFKHKDYQKDSAILSNFFIKGLKNLGFCQYEISNFAKKNYECKHNLGYWKGDEYIGFGAFSVGCFEGSRFYAYKSVNKYIKEPMYRKTELLSKDDFAFERVFLGLRSKIGVNKNYIKNKNMLEILLKEKKLKERNNRIYNENFLLADELACELF